MPSMTAVRWNPRVEGLRGFSILLVFVYHLGNPGRHNWGALGVGLFFIISGYVITGSLHRQLSSNPKLKNKTLQFLKDFYIRRTRRLLPLAFLIILLTLSLSFFDSTSDKKQYILSSIFCLLYIGNLFGFTFGYTDLAPALGHFWSLAVEEQFYFLWPIIFYFALKHIKKTFVSWITFVILIIEISHPLISFTGVSVWTLPSTYFDLLLLGCALSLVNERLEGLCGGILKIIYLAGVCSLFFVVFGYKFSNLSFLSHFQYNFNFFFTGVLFIFCLRFNLFNNFLFRFFGKISYSLYCIHVPLIIFCKDFLGWNNKLMLFVAVIAVALAALSHRYFEVRFYKPSLST